MNKKRTRRTKAEMDAVRLAKVVKAQKSKGLGDVVEKITTATGIKAVVETFTKDGTDCGCNERKAKMNEIFNFRRKPECLTEDEYSYLTEYFKSTSLSDKVKHTTQSEVIVIYNRIMNTRVKAGGCSGCFRDIHQAMSKVYNAY